MGRHQIIYTSCKRGISGINDGQQIYSHDRSFPDPRSDDIKRLFAYQAPSLENGVVMSDEIVPLMPQSFSFRKLKDGALALSLNTYLGRDYMGGSGRFGNQLSHVVVFDRDELKTYPCDFYGGPLLRSGMNFDEVNDPNPPDYLPAPELTVGEVLNIGAVADFLNSGDRIEIYKKMLCCALSFKNSKKRVVICDERENVIMWIAALQYSLPLDLAVNLSFTTYAYDPALSAYQICGVIPEGTKYDSDQPEHGRQHFLFDMLNNVKPDLKAENDFLYFAGVSMSFSYESMAAFHRYLIDNYSYADADEQYYAAYTLYSIGTEGLGDLSLDEVEKAIAFCGEYAADQEKLKIISRLISDSKKMLKVDDQLFLTVFRFALISFQLLGPDIREKVRTMVVDRILSNFSAQEKTEAEFVSFFKAMDDTSGKSGIYFADELMRDSNRAKLFSVMQGDVPRWKISFILDILGDYVKLKKIPTGALVANSPVGEMFYGIVRSFYAKNGEFIVSSILEQFSWDWEYLTNMALNLDGVLLGTPSGKLAAAHLWDTFYRLTAGSGAEIRMEISRMFADRKRYEQLFGFFSHALGTRKNVRDSRELLDEHIARFVNADDSYSGEYLQRALQAYYERVENGQPGEVSQAEDDLLKMILERKYEVPFFNDLADSVIARIPYKSPTMSISELLTAISPRIDEMSADGALKTRRLMAGALIEKTRLCIAERIKTGVPEGRINLRGMSSSELNSYLNWIVPHIYKSCRTSDDFKEIYSIFDMTNDSLLRYISICTEQAFDDIRTNNEYSGFCNFWRFLLSTRSLEKTEMARILGGLRRGKLKTLDEEVRRLWRGDKNVIRAWDEIYELTLSANPIIRTVTNIFRKFGH
jgi:hypothetical protein